MVAARLFFISITMLALFGGRAFASKDSNYDSEHCRARLDRMVCIVEPVSDVFRHTNVLDRKCLNGGERHGSIFKDIFSSYPKALQAAMCRLNRIFVEKSFWASGYAHIRANSIGIQQDALDKRSSLSDWATWKEQRAYSHSTTNDEPNKQLPTVSAHLPLSLRGAAHFIVTHELAHLIDKATGASERGPGSFAALSWTGHDGALEPRTLPRDWKQPCFYLCRIPKYATAKPSSAYAALERSSFVSLYATRSPAEDFAETLTFYVMSRLPEFQYVIRADGLVIDIKQKLTAEIMRPKILYMQNLLRRLSKGDSVASVPHLTKDFRESASQSY